MSKSAQVCDIFGEPLKVNDAVMYPTYYAEGDSFSNVSVVNYEIGLIKEIDPLPGSPYMGYGYLKVKPMFSPIMYSKEYEKANKNYHYEETEDYIKQKNTFRIESKAVIKKMVKETYPEYFI